MLTINFFVIIIAILFIFTVSGAIADSIAQIAERNASCVGALILVIIAITT